MGALKNRACMELKSLPSDWYPSDGGPTAKSGRSAALVASGGVASSGHPVEGLRFGGWRQVANAAPYPQGSPRLPPGQSCHVCGAWRLVKKTKRLCCACTWLARVKVGQDD